MILMILMTLMTLMILITLMTVYKMNLIVKDFHKNGSEELSDSER
jgi:hypothetical protein